MGRKPLYILGSHKGGLVLDPIDPLINDQVTKHASTHSLLPGTMHGNAPVTSASSSTLKEVALGPNSPFNSSPSGKLNGVTLAPDSSFSFFPSSVVADKPTQSWKWKAVARAKNSIGVIREIGVDGSSISKRKGECLLDGVQDSQKKHVVLGECTNLGRLAEVTEQPRSWKP